MQSGIKYTSWLALQHRPRNPTNAQLQDALRHLGRSTAGAKAILMERLCLLFAPDADEDQVR